MKNMGKEIRLYHWIPMLDDMNLTDQGIDATGLSTANSVTIFVTDYTGYTKPFQAEGTTAALALTAAQTLVNTFLGSLGVTGADYAAKKTAFTTLGGTVVENAAVNAAGNLYGSSKDIGTITGKLPVIGENGGRINRVGFTRLEIKGSIANYGIFHEYTEDSLNFDTEPQLLAHITREITRGANEVTEDMIQSDLLNAAGVILFGGTATSDATMTEDCGLTYGLLDRAEQILNDNRCPVDTTIIKGSTMTDTRTIGAARYVYIGSELTSTLRAMKDYHNQAAFIPVQQYASAGSIASGEIGAIGNFRFIVATEMQKWAGKGATDTDSTHRATGGKLDIFPMLIVGSGAFTTVGFQSSATGGSKFKIIHKKPGIEVASKDDPYGKTGFYSMQWYDYCHAA